MRDTVEQHCARVQVRGGRGI